MICGLEKYPGVLQLKNDYQDSVEKSSHRMHFEGIELDSAYVSRKERRFIPQEVTFRWYDDSIRDDISESIPSAQISPTAMNLWILPVIINSGIQDIQVHRFFTFPVRLRKILTICSAIRNSEISA